MSASTPPPASASSSCDKNSIPDKKSLADDPLAMSASTPPPASASSSCDKNSVPDKKSLAEDPLAVSSSTYSPAPARYPPASSSSCDKNSVSEKNSLAEDPLAMTASTPPPAPASSPPSSAMFPVDMVGRHVNLFLLYREGEIAGVHREADQERTVIKFSPHGLISSSKNWRVETKGGLVFHGDVNLDDEASTEASILVKDSTVRSCRCCRELGVPTPPFSPTMVGMKIRFSEPEPHMIEASVLEVERRHTSSVVKLQMTNVAPYSARMGDRLMLRSDLATWETDVLYFGDKENTWDDEGCSVKSLENQICVHVQDEHVPQDPKCLPYTKIFVRPAQGRPAIGAVTHKGKGDSQRKRKSSAHQENEANQKKIKVAINGYRDVGRALARVALESEDVELAVINDPSITDQVSCMFKDSKCDFEVKNSNSGILSFGKKEVPFFRESDPSAFWYMVKTKLVVTTSYSSEKEENDNNRFAYSQTSDPTVSGPLEMILGTDNCSTPLKNSWAPILTIRPINQSDAKAVGDCFPLWKGRRAVSVVRFQGTDVVFELEEFPNFDLMPNNTQPSIDFKELVRWCFHMLSRVPAAVCDVEMSERLRRGGVMLR